MEEIGFLTYNNYKYKPIIKVRLVYEKERIADILYFQHVGISTKVGSRYTLLSTCGF